MHRRSFIQLLKQLFCLGTAITFSSVVGSQIFVGQNNFKSLSAFLDTLLPEDGDSPPASQFNISDQLIAHAQGIENYPALLRLGCQWLDAQAKALGHRHFLLLEPAEQIRIVNRAENAPMDSIPHLFFNRTRQDSFTLYYSHPEAWRDLGLAHPPQPLGFLDFSAVPAIPKAKG